MKKLLVLALAMLMLLVCAHAEEIAEIAVTVFDDYAQSFAEFTEKEWKADESGLIHVISPEEGVTVSVCLAQENVACISVEFPCDMPADCVRTAIENLGWLSDEAIEQMFALTDDAQLEAEGFAIYRVHGENRDAFSICPADEIENMVWQPIHGGEKLHTEVECSGMDVARMITAEAAQLTGWENCKHCSEQQVTDSGNT